MFLPLYLLSNLTFLFNLVCTPCTPMLEKAMTNTTKVPSTNEAYVTKRGSSAPNKKAAHGPPIIWWAIGGLGSGRGGGFDPPFLQFASPKAGFFQKRSPDFRVITFSSYYLLIFSKYAKTPHESAVFLLCIFFVNTICHALMKEMRALDGPPHGGAARLRRTAFCRRQNLGAGAIHLSQA